MKWVPCCENTSSGESHCDGVDSHGQEFTGLPLCRGGGLGGGIGGKIWWRERWAEEAATKRRFEMLLLTQGLAHQQGAFQNSWAIVARFLGMFLFLLIIEERVSKIYICICQLIKMSLSI